MIQITTIMKSHLYFFLLLQLTPGEDDNHISFRSMLQGVERQTLINHLSTPSKYKVMGVKFNVTYNVRSTLARINTDF